MEWCSNKAWSRSGVISVAYRNWLSQLNDKSPIDQSHHVTTSVIEYFSIPEMLVYRVAADADHWRWWPFALCAVSPTVNCGHHNMHSPHTLLPLTACSSQVGTINVVVYSVDQNKWHLPELNGWTGPGNYCSCKISPNERASCIFYACNTMHVAC